MVYYYEPPLFVCRSCGQMPGMNIHIEHGELMGFKSARFPDKYSVGCVCGLNSYKFFTRTQAIKSWNKHFGVKVIKLI